MLVFCGKIGYMRKKDPKFIAQLYPIFPQNTNNTHKKLKNTGKSEKNKPKMIKRA